MHSTILVKVGSRSLSAAINVMVPNSLGPGSIITHYGTDAQKAKWLPRLADGRDIPCFALTEPHVGSDATSIQTRGTVTRDADGKIGINIDNINKRYITLAPIATLIGLAIDLHDPENLLGKGEHPGITVVLVPRDTDGLEIGNRHRPMDVAFQNGPIRGKIRMNVEDVVGGLNGVGKGWPMLVEQLSVGRGISLPGVSTAGGKLASRTIGAYSRLRRQFGYPVGMFEGVEEAMARIAGMTYIADAARTATVQMIDRGENPAIPGAILKYHLTENMRKVIMDGMDVLGGKAVMNGPQNLLANIYKGMPIAITVEGANIMTRNLIIFGQGSVRAHPYMLDELAAAAQDDKDKAAQDLSALLKKHVGNVSANTIRSMTRGTKSPVDDKDTAKYYRQINRLSASFSVAANATLGVLGGDLKRKERISARLGDVLSNLYLASCVLRHYEVQGRNKEDLPLVKWSVQHCLHNATEAMHELLENYPNKAAGLALRAAIMPRLRGVSRPSDRLDRAVVKTIYDPGAARDRLTAGIFIPGDNQPDDPVYRIEKALKLTVETEHLEKKLREAVKEGALPKDLPPQDLLQQAEWRKILTPEEVKQLQDAAKARDDVVNVDDYVPVQKRVPTPK
jgi:alkylation response protein AidB-like acyl-CoA dehydrogenase